MASKWRDNPAKSGINGIVQMFQTWHYYFSAEISKYQVTGNHKSPFSGLKHNFSLKMAGEWHKNPVKSWNNGSLHTCQTCQYYFSAEISKYQAIATHKSPIRLLDFSNWYIFWTVWPFFLIFCMNVENHEDETEYTFNLITLNY